MDSHDSDYRPLAGVPLRPDRGWFIAAGHGHFQRTADDAHRSSPIAAEEIEATGADYVALGHWHVTTDVSVGEVIAWYPGAPMGMPSNGTACLVTFETGVGDRGRSVSVDHVDVTPPGEGCAGLVVLIAAAADPSEMTGAPSTSATVEVAPRLQLGGDAVDTPLERLALCHVTRRRGLGRSVVLSDFAGEVWVFVGGRVAEASLQLGDTVFRGFPESLGCSQFPGADRRLRRARSGVGVLRPVVVPPPMIDSTKGATQR